MTSLVVETDIDVVMEVRIKAWHSGINVDVLWK